MLFESKSNFDTVTTTDILVNNQQSPLWKATSHILVLKIILKGLSQLEN